MNRRGSVSIISAVMMVTLIGMSGLAIDLSRLWLVRDRLRHSLDAAALVAAREMSLNATQRNTDATNMFYANFRAQGGGLAVLLGATTAAPTFTQVDANTVAIQGQATVPTTLLRVLSLIPGTNPAQSTMVTASATAQRQTTGLELSLVLDNTGSMAGAPIQAVQSAATQLVNTVFGNSGSGTPPPNLYVAIVPFSSSVNVGPTANHIASWLAPNSFNASSYDNKSWMGCVMARHAGGHDFDDATPSQAPFTALLYSSTYQKEGCRSKNARGQCTAYVTGDNDWTPSNITEDNQANLSGNTAVGPDLGCVPLPIQGETTNQQTLLNLISQMVPTYRGGTFINLGLQAGWFTLSPNWQGLWGNSKLPLAYNTAQMQKVIVLMTDGNNSWYSWPGGAPDNQGDADFTAYGRFSTNSLGLTSQSQATTYLNNAMATMCQNIKAVGITIYTILFNHDGGISSDTQTLFQNCASTPSDYFLAPTSADLQAAFSQIGTQLANLRLTQ